MSERPSNPSLIGFFLNILQRHYDVGQSVRIFLSTRSGAGYLCGAPADGGGDPAALRLIFTPGRILTDLRKRKPMVELLPEVDVMRDGPRLAIDGATVRPPCSPGTTHIHGTKLSRRP